MIRINLLPVRAARKKESIRFQLTIAGLSAFFTVALLIIWFLVAGSESRHLKAEIADEQAELAELKTKTGTLDKVEKQKELVQAKLDSIKELEAGRTGPTDMFSSIGSVIPKKAWITSLDETAHKISIEGFAATEDDISRFLRGLQKEKKLGHAELVVAEMDKALVKDRELFKFSIRIER